MHFVVYCLLSIEREKAWSAELHHYDVVRDVIVISRPTGVCDKSRCQKCLLLYGH